MITPIRQTCRRARSLEFDTQLQECVEQLQHPELIATELLTSHSDVARSLDATRLEPLGSSCEEPVDRSRPFYPARDIFVVRDSSSFTCLATDVAPIPLDDPSQSEGAEGLDYLVSTSRSARRSVS
jgi:hypothetical protein